MEIISNMLKSKMKIMMLLIKKNLEMDFKPKIEPDFKVKSEPNDDINKGMKIMDNMNIR